MGLFSRLFSKEPVEVKVFWKAFDKLLKKSNEKNFKALEVASAACPDIWQGPFLLGLVIELHNKIPYDEEKANEYHYIAKKIASKGADAEWVSTFYKYYEASAMNTHYPDVFPREALATRRLGVAALNCYSNMIPVVYAHEKNDDSLFWSLIIGRNSYFFDFQSSPFTSVFNTWNVYEGGKGNRELLLSYTNDFIKEKNKITLLGNKLKKKKEKGEEIEDYKQIESLSMYGYAMACCLIYPSPMILYDWNFTKECGSEFNAGISQLICNSSYGCAASIHLLVNLYFSENEEIQNMTRNAYKRSNYNVTENHMFNWLLKGAESGDSECAMLLKKYFIED